MPTIHVTQLPPDTPWQEFEKITKDGMALKWGSPTLQSEGRPGQKQNGVDIFGPDYLGRPVAIQCKKYTSFLKLATIQKEVANAEKFQAGCKLNCLYIATTAPRDAKLQSEVRALSEERIKQGKFAIGLLYWEDIFTGLILDPNILVSHFPGLKFPEVGQSATKKGSRIAALTLGYYGPFLWHYLELMLGEFGWMAGQDPEEARTLIRIVRKNSNVAPKQISVELLDWSEQVESEIFSPKGEQDWDLIKTLAKRIEDRVKHLSSILEDVTDADFVELGMSIGGLFNIEGDLTQKKALELSRKICVLLPSASLSLPETIDRLVGKDCYRVSPVLLSIAERELRWPTTV